ncbi:AbrB family transcriptional regulator [Rhodophyticola sp. CCM32]|uniref:AbrB family transcriptional regulator n=1 Tax=Rhodophyticola sp. CCM32 TaxID=2916397 RepID=UPI00107F2436|nr:AbrB family transcriptional regulator [Rhodophyticola sp. CCM32]QBX99875.1 AbrB family transcriptional regulator [Rhodophyticola sp. CCM32]
MYKTGTTLGIGAIGAAIAWALGIPAPFLTGPAALVSLAALMGVTTDVPVQLRDVCFVLIGVGMGAGVTPEVLVAARQWPIPLVALSLLLLVIFFGGSWALGRVFGYDRNTARLAATPGHLSFVLSLSTEVKADIPIVAVVQSLRVLILTLLVPAVVALITDADLSMSTAPATPMALPALALIVVLAIGLGLLLKRWNIPAALLLAGMAVSTAAHGAGLVPGGMPLWIAIPTFVIMGTLIGTRFSGVTLALVIRAAAASVFLTVLALIATLVAALIVHHLSDLPLTDLMIAFAPGGLETMAALSIMLGADPAFTALHHIYRLVFLTVLVPVFIPARVKRRRRPGRG